MRILKLAALALIGVLSTGAAPQRANWALTVAVTPAGSHVMGNPAADLKLAEYVSYTCPHCAQFQIQSEAPIGLAFVMPGKLSVEVRHFLRDPVDLTAAMLTNCGEPGRFFRNHNTFLKGQSKWIVAMERASAAQRQRWTSGDPLARRRAIATDFGFYGMMEGLGYSRAVADRCLADEAMARRLAAQTQEGARIGVEGTPSFLLNGDLLAGTHDWRSLETQLRARI